MSSLVDAVNGQTATSKVSAAISRDGELVLSTADGSDIQIDPPNLAGTVVNALGVTAGLFTGQVSLSATSVTGKIELGFGTGSPADLAKLGFRTGAYISGKVPDDLLVFVTGAGNASVSASYSGNPIDAKQALRAQPMQITFTTATRYTIKDVKTGTVLAERDFDPVQLKAGISYQGLHMSFTSPPKAGDGFRMDGNVDGTGNNDNMLALAALERKALVGNKTLGTAYIDHVNDMGNIARQATIAKVALTVVHDQAVSSRDQVAGVSLDQEAADLIRFQQAYQASAKILQVASQLFDSILQVR
jgi:flagellar hook-associated protein FlgK